MMGVTRWTSEMTWALWLFGLASISAVALLARNRLRRAAAPSDPGTAGGSVASPGREPPTGAAAFWWVTLALLLAWNALPSLVDNTPRIAKIPYSTFIEQVQQNNVAQVGIQGSEIAGTLKTPRDWMHGSGRLTTAPAKGAQTPPAKPASTAGPNTSAVPHTAAEPTPVTAFTTVFPSSVGDPGLLAQLEQHQVAIAAVPRSEHDTARIIASLLPTALLVGFFWWMGRRAMQQQQSIFGAGKSQVRRFVRLLGPRPLRCRHG